MTELSDMLVLNRVYVLMVGGREHNVYVDQIGDFYISGRVAQNKVAVLVDRPGRGGAVIKVILPQDEKTAIGPGDELLHSEPCVVPSKTLRARFLLEDVSVIEDPWRPMLHDEIFTENGIDADELCKALPSFSQYNVKGKGFVGNADTWNRDLIAIKAPIPMIADEDVDSSDD